TVISVAHNVGKALVDGADDCASRFRRESQRLTESVDRAPHDAEQLRIAEKLQAQQGYALARSRRLQGEVRDRSGRSLRMWARVHVCDRRNSLHGLAPGV